LIPGLLCDAEVWVHQLHALGASHTATIPDVRPAPSIGEAAELILATQDGSFSLAGHSMGARIALEVVRRAPDRIERLALLDTGVHPRGPAEEAKRGALVDLGYREGMAAVALVWLPPMLHPANMHLIERLTEMVMRSTPESFERQQRALLNRPNAGEVLAMVHCPTLVLCGRDDRWSPLSQHEEIAAAIPGSKLVIVNECGHMSPVEQPSAVTAALLEWVS
jgi:pimeloyl-ACP methyl ester carboxylesterase